MAASVDSVSAAGRKPETRTSPSDMAARIAARCEIDLSGGGVIVPARRDAGSNLTLATVGDHLGGIAELLDQLDGSLAAALARDPQRDRTRLHVRRGIQRHVDDVHPGLAEGERD